MKEPFLTDEAKNDPTEIWATTAEARDERAANRMNQKLLAACRSKAQFSATGNSEKRFLLGSEASWSVLT